MKKLTQTVLAALFVVSMLLPIWAYASTAANTTITNTVTVTYEDASSNPYSAQASVGIEVLLVASAPILTSPASIDPSAENTANNLVYTITSTANGPDTYDFTSSDTRTNMNVDAVFTTPSAILGATTFASNASIGVSVISVPFDGNDADGAVNGIAAGATIVLDPSGTAEVFTVDSIDESTGAASNTVTITLVGATTAAYTAGAIIGEQDSVTVVATTDEVTTGATGSHSVLTTATSQFNAAVSTTQSAATVITVRRPQLLVTKYVRNITNPTFTGAAPYVLNAITWYGSGVSGNPGDEMEYLIVMDNTNADATTANNIVVSDPVPQFTTYQANSIELDDDGTAANLAGFAAQLDGNADNDAAELDAAGNGTVIIYAGVGGDDTTATGGDLLQGEISRAVFRVTID